MQSPSHRSVVIISGLLTLIVLGTATLAVGFRNGWLHVATGVPSRDAGASPAPFTSADPGPTPPPPGGPLGSPAREAGPEQREIAVYRQKLEEAYRALDDAYAQVRSLQTAPPQIASRDRDRRFNREGDGGHGERGSRRDFEDD